MTNDELVALVHEYAEFDDELDETCCSTGFVNCRICGGGGKTYNIGRQRGRLIKPTHTQDCPRGRFEKEYPVKT
jgi:hypothetical protein